jgi:hypothetical protein
VLSLELSTDAGPNSTLKLVGRWYRASALRFQSPTDSIGPTVSTRDPDGRIREAAILASPATSAEHVLLVTSEIVEGLGVEPEMLMFYGGFDPPEIMNDTSRDAGFLAFMYPITNAEGLRAKLGTVDFNS